MIFGNNCFPTALQSTSRALYSANVLKFDKALWQESYFTSLLVDGERKIRVQLEDDVTVVMIKGTDGGSCWKRFDLSFHFAQGFMIKR